MKFGLIGHPISHSLSPFLFNAGYQGRYTYELLEEEDFEKAYSRFTKEYDGINVTAPFKEHALLKADIITDECRMVGATNLLVKTSEGIKAYNSDFRGLVRWLRENSSEEDRHSTHVLVIGYGGAGKAAAAAAHSLGMRVTIINRTAREEGILPLSEFGRCFREADIVIYSIPAPIRELDTLSDEDIRGGKEPEKKIIMEANYRNPSFSDLFISRMKEVNPHAIYTDGKVWLLYQAVTGYELFTGESPDLKKMSEVL